MCNEVLQNVQFVVLQKLQLVLLQSWLLHAVGDNYLEHAHSQLKAINKKMKMKIRMKY